ncbi:MAG: formate--phosphoribosylaminoimidazolecarboxamide ligase [Candidatus Thermoplasmatota archaeon]|nr:formate--phosphoribosylaminoimidazolecarboxamide ligase [Candidatus Thermoplasmatota archaeon]MBU1915051.1 formate--phosphoribosylaminoimidazolecarboxamide ligase [Candidatus Thermoplasmatota archaeon]
MVSKDRIDSIIEGYDKDNLVVATACSHTSLQIFDGARKEGLKTMGIAVGQKTKFYDAFPLGKPDEFFYVDSYSQLLEKADELIEKNVILIPHGSFVEYMTPKNFVELEVPTFGNRHVLDWESDRDKERKWLVSAGLEMPHKIEDPKLIDRPVLVKYDGAKGGRGFFIAKDYPDFKLGIDHSQKFSIQEYILGTRYYIHYFYSPVRTEGYKMSKGVLELLSIDRRDESNVDEMYKLGAQEELKKLGHVPTFVVTGNVPVVVRESLLPKLLDMGERVVERSLTLFGGMIGPFCLECIVTDNLSVKVFEISSRIVAGTNPFISGSPYSDLIEPGVSSGRRIAQEIKYAKEHNQLGEILT